MYSFSFSRLNIITLLIPINNTRKEKKKSLFPHTHTHTHTHTYIYIYIYIYIISAQNSILTWCQVNLPDPTRHVLLCILWILMSQPCKFLVHNLFLCIYNFFLCRADIIIYINGRLSSIFFISSTHDTIIMTHPPTSNHG
jgi:hypothetical protein